MRTWTISIAALALGLLGCDTGTRHERRTLQPGSTAFGNPSGIGSGTTGSGNTIGTIVGGNSLIPPGGNSQIAAISPDRGSSQGDTPVVITGQGFVQGSTVEFDGQPATQVNFVSSSQIECRTPVHAPGQVPPGGVGFKPHANTQPPPPSHVDPGHSTSGSCPLRIAAQVPSTPPVLAALQASHKPPHAASQQTPSTQLPLVHSMGPPQVAPFICAGMQFVPSQ